MSNISNIEVYNAREKWRKEIEYAITECEKYIDLDIIPRRNIGLEYLFILATIVDNRIYQAFQKETLPEYIRSIFTYSYEERVKASAYLNFDELQKDIRENKFDREEGLSKYTLSSGLFEDVKISIEFQALEPKYFRKLIFIPIIVAVEKINFVEAVKKLARKCQIDFDENLIIDAKSFENLLVKERNNFMPNQDQLLPPSPSRSINDGIYWFYDYDDNYQYIQYIFQKLYGENVLLPDNIEIFPYFLKEQGKFINLFNMNYIVHNKDATIILLHNDIPMATFMQENYYKISNLNMLNEMSDKLNILITKFKSKNQIPDREKICQSHYYVIFYNGQDITNLGYIYNTTHGMLVYKINEIERIPDNELVHPILYLLETMKGYFSIDKQIPPFETLSHEYDLDSDIVFSSYYGESLQNFNLLPLKKRRVGYLSKFPESEKEAFLEDCLEFLEKIRTWEKSNEKLHIELFFVSWPDVNKVTFYRNTEELFEEVKKFNIEVPPTIAAEYNTFLINSISSPYKLSFLIDPIIGEKSYNLIVAKRSSGKTWLALGIAYSYVMGKNIFKEWKVKDPGKVLYVNGDMEPYILKERAVEFKKMYFSPYDRTNKELLKHVILYTPQDIIDLTTKEGQNEIEREIGKAQSKGNPDIPVRLLIIDTLSTLAEDATSPYKWKELIKWFKKLKEAGLSILLLHHTNKQETVLGTIKIENHADCVLYLNKRKASKSVFEFEIYEEKNRRAPDGNTYIFQLIFGRKRLRWKYIPNEKRLDEYNWRAPDEEKIRIIQELLKKKYSVSEIADLYSVSKSTIEKFKQKNGIYARANRQN